MAARLQLEGRVLDVEVLGEAILQPDHRRCAGPGLRGAPRECAVRAGRAVQAAPDASDRSAPAGLGWRPAIRTVSTGRASSRHNPTARVNIRAVRPGAGLWVTPGLEAADLPAGGGERAGRGRHGSWPSTGA